MSYQSVLSKYHFKEQLVEIPELPFSISLDDLVRIYNAMEVNTFFTCTTGGLPEDSTYWVTVVRTEQNLIAYQSEAVLIFTPGPDPATYITLTPTEEDWKQIFLLIGHEKIKLSHYKYLDLMLNEFWKLVFNKTANEMFCGGIVSAHGDKGSGYKFVWEENNIPFNRGMLLFLLTYTKKLGDTPKHESDTWVIQHYPEYLPLIEQAEKAVGLA